MVIDLGKFRSVLGHYPTGVCVITATSDDGTPVGLVVGSFTSVSLDPPLVGFFPDRSSSSWPKVESAGKFCVNVLAAHQRDVCRSLASKSTDKFSDVAYRLSPLGQPILDDVVAWVECDLHAVQEAGDHFFVMGKVLALDVEQPYAPLLFFQGGYGQFSPVTAGA